MPSLIIYDDGEGQKPEYFEDTLLSLLKGNKNKIHFVHGKYNMGGSGAIVFCGEKKYQLIGSRRYDRKSKFGFTLIRIHPFSKKELSERTTQWYEYFKFKNEIPSFYKNEMDLKLYNRKFLSGTIIKLYSYSLPPGLRSDISRDLNRSLNEYLFEPALPIYIIERKERYPKNRALERDLYGLKRRLEEVGNKYIEDHFSEDFENKEIGRIKITCYVFKTRIDRKSVKESKDVIKKEFFLNNMSVLFSLNGQVHGDLKSEFITRTLNMSLLKDYLLIHVDCTDIKYEFRKELTMASRDRLKQSDELSRLRQIVAMNLKNGKLSDIHKSRRNSITFESSDTNDLFKSFAKNLPLKSDLLQLLSQTFKLNEKHKKRENKKEKQTKTKLVNKHFKSKRYPTYFKLDTKNKGKQTLIKAPMGGNRTIKFNTDVENQYFVRVEYPGELKIALVGYKTNDTEGGNKPECHKDIQDVFDVQKKSPDKGTIKIILSPTEEVNVGDLYQVKTTLSSPGKDFDQIFWVKISEPDKHKEPQKQKEDVNENKVGLPPYILVYKERASNEQELRKTWDDLSPSGISFDFDTIMHPYVNGDALERIFINMDSKVFKNYKSNLKNEDQMSIAEKRYISSVYFHTLFLYTISKKKNYSMSKIDGDKKKDVDIVDYLKDIFDSYYSQFLLNFEMTNLIESLDE